MNIILFDFDGVIVGTFSFCYEISNSTSPITKEEYRARFEGNIYDAIKKAGPSSKKVDFFSEYTPQLLEAKPVEEIVDAIKSLSNKYTLVIISSTISSSIIKFLEMYDLRKYFKDILGPEVDESKTRKILMILEKYSVTPNQAVFVTDTLGDIKEARECSVKSIAVAWGYHPAETLMVGSPYKLISHQSEIVPAVEAYFDSIKTVE